MRNLIPYNHVGRCTMMMRKMRFLMVFSLGMVLLQGFNAYSQKTVWNGFVRK